MTPNKSASPAQISDEPNPLLIVCEFCHSKPYYACINTSTQRPMPFYHMARIRDARSRLEPVETPKATGLCSIGECLHPVQIGDKLVCRCAPEPVEAVSTTPKGSNDDNADVRMVRLVDRSVLGSEEADLVPLPITDDRDQDYVDPRLRESADLIVSSSGKVSTPLPQQVCGGDEVCEHKHCWDASRKRVRGGINKSRREWLDSQKSPALPQQEEPAKLGTCADFPNTPHAQGTCENCDMWSPIAPLLGQDEPVLTDDLVESIQEVSKLRAELTQALTSLAAARAQNESLWQEMLSFQHNTATGDWIGSGWTPVQMKRVIEESAEIRGEFRAATSRAELAEASLAEAQTRISELEKELGR